MKPSGRLYRFFLAATALFGLLCPVGSFALDPAKSVYQDNCQSWTRREDLPANAINAIAQTRDGYLWLGTSNGLVRFDGFEFKEVELPDSISFRSRDISSLASSKAGGLWFGLNAGSVGCYDGHQFSSVANVSWMNSGMDVRSVWEDGNAAVWVAAQTGAGRFVEGVTNGLSLGNGVRAGMSLGGGSRGRVWVGTARHGLYYWQEGRIARFPDNSIDRSIVFAVAEDSAGQIWVGTENGLRCYDASFHRKEIGDCPFEVRSLLVDRHGVVWIGTSGNGLMCWKNGAGTSFKKSGGLASDFVTALFEDREGSLWVGTREGLSQITDLRFPIFSSAEGLIGGSCHAVAASPGGGLWAAMSGGLSFFDGREARNYTGANGLTHPDIKRVFEAKNGDIYLITGAKQVQVFSGGRIAADYPNQDWPGAFAEDAQGVVVSVASNLFRVSISQFVPYSFKDGQAPPFVWIHNMAAGRDGSLWIASVNGIFRVKDGTCQRWSVPEGLSWDKVHSVFEDSDGTVWAGLLTGMARLKNNQIRNITRANGLFDDFIFAIVPDDLGWFWVNSKRGIFRVSRQSLNDFCDGKADQVRCDAYDGSEMIKTVRITDQEWVGCKTRDGRIWFPSSQGVVMIDPALPHINPTPPLVHITQVCVNGLELKRSHDSAVLRGKGGLAFQYTALSYVAPQKVRFRHQLEGYDHEWIESGNKRSVAYSNLKPGKYAFRVTACNADGVWNAAGDSFAIDLLPSFYQTIWFYLGCVVMAIAALMGIYGWRVRHLRQRQRELEKARELLEARVKERTVELEAQKQQLEREIEERKKLQEQFLQAQKMEAIGQLAGGVAHDFNNILTVIQGSASLLLNPQLNPAEKSDCSHQVIRAAERAAGLIRQLLLFSRKQVMQPVNLDLNEVVGGMTRMLKRILGEHIAFRSDFASSLPPVFGDAGMIEQVVLNLAVNARDAMPEGGALTIATGAETLDEQQAQLNPDASPGPHVWLSVSDTGCGIPPENLPRIFEPFFTTKNVGKGTGLGLATVYGITRQHRGWVTVNSEPGKGTTFRICLPAAAGSRAGEKPAALQLQLPRGAETVLLVEDDLPVRLLVSNLLQRCGYTVLQAESGAAALRIWRENLEKIHLLLTDMVMPDGMTGRQLARQLQSEKPALKVIYTSGYSAEAGEGPPLIDGVNFLQKPYPSGKLAQTVRNCLDRD